MGPLLPAQIYTLGPEHSGMPVMNGHSELTSLLIQLLECMRSEQGSRTKGEVLNSCPWAGLLRGLSRGRESKRALSSWVQAVKAKVEANHPCHSKEHCRF